jgi:beta-glucanase (GH16 family)
MFHKNPSFNALALTLGLFACNNTTTSSSVEAEAQSSAEKQENTPTAFTLIAANFTEQAIKDSSDNPTTIAPNEWLSYAIEVPQTGRYILKAYASGGDSATLWIEDYINNPDNRTYNITGDLALANASDGYVQVDGSPLQAGPHNIKVHATKSAVKLDSVVFTLLQAQTTTPDTLTQTMAGNDWQLVWSDEFDGTGLPDSTKWSYNVGNWGWGNHEPQYYTQAKTKNARQEDGALIIEAHKNDNGHPWTSARLSTQGKQTFLYGKIEFKAKVPVGRGTWAAGWLLGDAYRDEISWPYCGEIDVLETVGYEIDDATGDGLNHGSCHTRAYYFKQGNHLTATIPVKNMNTQWHTYGIEWYPDSIRAYVDDEFYYTYDKTANELEWPFDKPQNIILNLAVGGGWGGAKGIDPNWDKHQFAIDYVRVYQK